MAQHAQQSAQLPPSIGKARQGKAGASSWFQQGHLPAHLALSSSALVSSRNIPVVLGRGSGCSFMVKQGFGFDFSLGCLCLQLAVPSQSGK